MTKHATNTFWIRFRFVATQILLGQRRRSLPRTKLRSPWVRSLLLPLIAVAALSVSTMSAVYAQTQPQKQIIGLAAGELPGSDGASERLAVAIMDETTGKQTIVARLVARADGNGQQIGERIGDEARIDGAAIWGTGGTAMIDVEISSYLKPGHLLVLLDTFELVEIRGIWGTGGTAIPAPEDIKIHPPLWNVSACGKPTAMAEGLRRVADPNAKVDQPFLAVGTDGGCVGLAGIDQDSFEEPIFGFEEPIFGFGDPLVAIWGTSGTGQPVRDLVVHPTRVDWGVLDQPFTASTDNHVAHGPGWVPDSSRWAPRIDEWIPAEESWYEIAASSGDRVFGVFPGVLPVGNLQGVPAYSTYILEHSSALVFSSVVTARPAPDASPVMSIPPTLPEASLSAANGTQTVRLMSIGPGVSWGVDGSLSFSGETTLPVAPFYEMAAGSLWTAAANGQTVAFLPEYEHDSGTPGSTRELLADECGNDTTDPVISASLSPYSPGDELGDTDEWRYVVGYDVEDDCDSDITSNATAVLVAPGCVVPVANGVVVEYEMEDEEGCEFEVEDGVYEIEAPELSLQVSAEDSAGNLATETVVLQSPGADNDDIFDIDDD